MGFRSGDFRFSYENDGNPFGGTLGDGGDRHRTAAANIGIGEFSVGFNLFTGDYKNGDGTHSTETVNGHPDRIKRGKQQYGGQYTSGTANKYRLGAMYGSYKGFKFGSNSEAIRHAIQNKFAHTKVSYQSWYKVLNIQPQGYFQYQSYNNPFTLW